MNQVKKNILLKLLTDHIERKEQELCSCKSFIRSTLISHDITKLKEAIEIINQIKVEP